MSTDPCINDSERREAGHTAAPVIRIPLAGVPSHCPFCGIAAAFPLTVFGNQVSASCPACFRVVAPVAVTGEPTAQELIERAIALADDNDGGNGR